MNHIDMLKKLSACSDAVKWCEKHKSLSACWRYCKRADWLLWFAVKAGVDLKIVVAATCGCVEPVLKHIDAAETKKVAKNAIQTARKWCDGKATVGEVRIAADAAAAADADVAKTKAHEQMCKLIRKQITWKMIKEKRELTGGPK